MEFMIHVVRSTSLKYIICETTGRLAEKWEEGECCGSGLCSLGVMHCAHVPGSSTHSCSHAQSPLTCHHQDRCRCPDRVKDALNTLHPSSCSQVAQVSLCPVYSCELGCRVNRGKCVCRLSQANCKALTNCQY